MVHPDANQKLERRVLALTLPTLEESVTAEMRRLTG
jgi:hypothetical protein